MKYLIFALALLKTSGILGADRPEIIPSKITELRSPSWYSVSSKSWSAYLQNNRRDEGAWLQYFRALDYAGEKQELAGVLDDVRALFPESFVESYLEFRLEGWTPDGVRHLERALSLPHLPRWSLEDRLVYSEMKMDADRKERSQEVFEADLIHVSTLNYNYNLLMSVAENGTLVTDALHSSIPLWVLQDVMGVRQDVHIINLELVRSSTKYFSRKMAVLESVMQSPEELFSEEATANIHYAITLPRASLEEIEHRLYVVGLASIGGEGDFQHYEQLRENIEEKFLLDYLSVDFNGEPKTATGKVLSTNYIVPLLLLKEFYDEVNNERRSTEIRGLILRLANDSQMKNRVQMLLDDDREEPRNFKVISLDVKKWNKKMLHLKDNVYASDAEITIGEYWQFLDYLQSNGYTELFEASRQDLSRYDDLTADLLSKFYYSPENLIFQKKHEKHGVLRHPVIDISYEGVQAYCEWLTVQYNAQPNRKYQEVLFRLPTESEWKMAAFGYKGFQSWTFEENTIEAHLSFNKKGSQSFNLTEYEVDYPWAVKDWSKRKSITNHHECYLANIGAPEEITCPAGIKGDGWSLTSPVGTYFPNNIGLFDVIGNVAEMIDIEGIAMGGSWRQPAEECTIHSKLTYETSDVRVGARLFMEVIEE